ncbi:MAG: hypothetical protein GY765_42410 [bacterium]|nr:hypothetical protein [bacterium]
MITADKITTIAPYGQGPSDLQSFMALFHHGDDLAFLEFQDKIKVLSKKDGVYKCNEIKWLKRGYYHHFVTDAVYCQNKYFLAGVNQLEMVDGKIKSAKLIAFDEKGNILGNVVTTPLETPNRFDQMKHFVVAYKERVFYAPANQLLLESVSVNDLKVADVQLELPGFYKKMPDGYYAYKDYDGNLKQFGLDLEEWSTTYSSISKMVVSGNYLVIQVRTCNEKLKKFALLFYNLENNFKREKTIFTEDLLLGVRNGKFYMYNNGDPGVDVNTDACIINVYEVKQ